MGLPRNARKPTASASRIELSEVLRAKLETGEVCSLGEDLVCEPACANLEAIWFYMVGQWDVEKGKHHLQVPPGLQS